MGSCQQRPSSTRTSASRKITGPNRREGRNRIKQETVRYATGTDQQKPQAVAARLRCRQRKQALPLDVRDPDVVRAKDLQRKLPP
jgi:hypothetical protein